MVTGAHRVPPMGMSGRWRSAVSVCISLETTFNSMSHQSRMLQMMANSQCMLSSLTCRAFEPDRTHCALQNRSSRSVNLSRAT